MRGQVSLIDFLLAAVFFTMLFMAFLTVYTSEVSSNLKKSAFDRITLEGAAITDMMVSSKGFPDNWEKSPLSAKSIGFAVHSNNLSSAKITAFTSLDYSAAKTLLGLEPKTGYYLTVSPVANTSQVLYAGGLVPDGSAKLSIPFARYAAVNNVTVMLKLILYE